MKIFSDHLQQPHEKPDDAPVVWRPCAYGILTNERGEWFLVEPTWAKRWDLPGGGVEMNESVREGLVREFYEETGYRVRVVGEPLYLGESHFFHKKLGFCHCVILIFKVELAREQRDENVVNTFEDGFEIRRGEWVDTTAIQEKDVHPIYWPFIQAWQKSQIG